MADLTRAYDWSHTPVGPIDEWPEALLITVNTLLCSRHPMFLWWGEELVQFYNDAYRPSIREDKHPSALGQRGRECWPEIWPIIGPQIEAVMTRGEASWHENQLVPIYRNGKLEDVYWTYGYSPVRSSTGEICGTLVVCTETTEIILARHQSQLERERLADLFQQAPAFFAVLRGPEHVFEMVNPPYQELIGQRDLLGKTVREAVPEAAEQGFIALLDEVYRTGQPYVGRGTPIQLARGASQPLEVRYLDFVYQPRREQDGTVSGIIVLGVDVTESKRAEQVLLQSEKLNAVGRLASSIAHEINNPLEAVTNLLYLAQRSAVSPTAQHYLEAAEVELQRVSAIANQTLRFYRQSTNPRPAKAEDLIGGTLPLYQGRLTNSRVTIERRDRVAPSLHVLRRRDTASPEQSRRQRHRRYECHTWWPTSHPQPRSHRLDHGTKRQSSDRRRYRARNVRLTRSHRIFEPFFTTKDTSGTGLGLWISREIVDRHRGVLRVRSSQSAPRCGTVFALFLPFDQEAQENSVQSISEEIATARE